MTRIIAQCCTEIVFRLSRFFSVQIRHKRCENGRGSNIIRNWSKTYPKFSGPRAELLDVCSQPLDCFLTAKSHSLTHSLTRLSAYGCSVWLIFSREANQTGDARLAYFVFNGRPSHELCSRKSTIHFLPLFLSLSSPPTSSLSMRWIFGSDPIFCLIDWIWFSRWWSFTLFTEEGVFRKYFAHLGAISLALVVDCLTMMMIVGKTLDLFSDSESNSPRVCMLVYAIQCFFHRWPIV